jgi:hypothetical protein
MSFGDTHRADEVGLAEHVTVRHPGTQNWVTGKVVELKLMADESIRIRIQLGNGYAFDLDCMPNDSIIWGDDVIDYSLEGD